MKKWKLWAISVGATLATLGLLYGLILSIICKGVASSEAAGWAQAIGAIAALGVAIWVSYDQHRQQEARDKRRNEEEVQGMLRSIRSEIEAAIVSLDRQVGPLLRESQPGTPFRVTFPIAEQPFPVYHGLIPKLGMIEKSDLRKQLVYTYSRGQGLVMTFRYNNDLIEDYADTKRRAAEGSAFDRADEASKYSTLIVYADQLRINHRETMEEIAKLLHMLPVH